MRKKEKEVNYLRFARRAFLRAGFRADFLRIEDFLAGFLRADFFMVVFFAAFLRAGRFTDFLLIVFRAAFLRAAIMHYLLFSCLHWCIAP